MTHDSSLFCKSKRIRLIYVHELLTFGGMAMTLTYIRTQKKPTLRNFVDVRFGIQMQ